MAVARPGLKAGAHARRQRAAAFVGVQRRPALKHINEFVLLRMRMAQRRRRIGREAREIHAKVGQPEQIAQDALLAARHARGKRLGIDRGLGAGGDIGGEDGDGGLLIWHIGLPGIGEGWRNPSATESDNDSVLPAPTDGLSFSRASSNRHWIKNLTMTMWLDWTTSAKKT